MMCGDWAKWGYPMPPYRVYALQDDQWQVVPFDETLLGRQSNLIWAYTESFLVRAKVTIEERIKMNQQMDERERIIVEDLKGCGNWK